MLEYSKKFGKSDDSKITEYMAISEIKENMLKLKNVKKLSE